MYITSGTVVPCALSFDDNEDKRKVLRCGRLNLDKERQVVTEYKVGWAHRTSLGGTLE